MTSTLVTVGPALGAAMLLLTAVAAATAAAGRLGHHRQIVTAAARAAVQLAVVSLVITAILGSLPMTALFVVFMYTVAVRTCARRLTAARSGWWAAVPILASSAPVVAGLLASGVLPPTGLAVIPVTGILVGGAMTATSLAGRRALDELATRRGEVEAALALGLSDRDAALEICRPAAAQALVPALDQTRSVGLVTLPGAFVGMLIGGASPVAAGAVQLLVLISLLAVEAVAVVLITELAVHGRFKSTTLVRCYRRRGGSPALRSDHSGVVHSLNVWSDERGAVGRKVRVREILTGRRPWRANLKHDVGTAAPEKVRERRSMCCDWI